MIKFALKAIIGTIAVVFTLCALAGLAALTPFIAAFTYFN